MRAIKTLLCALLLTAVIAVVASAKIVEMGSPSPVAIPSCPSRCTVLTRTTAYQARIGSSKTIDTVSRDGSVVAFTLSLGKPGKKETAFFVNTARLGNTPEARLTVLKPDPKKKLHYTVAGESPIENLTPYLGRKVQFPLATSIPVKKGWVIAISTPTWAPILAEKLAGTNAWRNIRPNACATTNPPPDTSVQTGDSGIFNCLWTRERLTFSATLITKAGTPVITTPTVPSTTTPTTTTTTTTTTDTAPDTSTSPTTTTKTTTTKATTPKKP